MSSNSSYHDPVLNAALDIAAAGKPVFLLWGIDDDGKCCCGDAGCKHPGKHPNGFLAPKGRNSATTNLDIIRRWFEQAPMSNIGMPTGPETGVAVLDVDARHGGWESIDAHERQYGDLPATHCVESGGGGLHLYFAYPIGQTIKTSTSQIGPGLDIRAQGGSIVLPPSLHESGRRYGWAEVTMDAMGPGESWTPMPGWLIALATKPARIVPQDRSFPTNSLKGMGTGNDSDGHIPDGQRNATLASRSGAMRRAGFAESEILAALLQMNQDRCHPPLPEQEVQRIAKSVSRYAPALAGGSIANMPFQGITIRNGKVA